MPTQYSLGGDPVEDKDSENTSHSSRDCSRKTQVESNITHIDCEDEIEAWVSSLDDELYGYFELELDVKQTIAEKQYAFTSRRCCEAPNPVLQRRYSFGGGAGSFPSIIKWLSETLAIPYVDADKAGVPVGRNVPKSNLRVFIPDAAYEFLEVSESEAEEILDRFHALEENHATERQIHILKKQREQRQLDRRTQSPLYTHKRAIEHTIRSRLGWSKSIGSGSNTRELPHKTIHGVPDSDERFDGWTLDELGDELTAVRKNIAMNEEYREELQEMYREQKDPTFEDLVRTHFPEFEQSLLG
jgi:hypothetical protein